MTDRRPSIAIVGAGFGGLAAAIELKRAGHDDIVILERGDDVGGVWRDNTYPGAACDVPSPFYCYSFAPNPAWPRRFSQQPAILDYIRDVVDGHDLRRHLRLSTEVVSAAYDESARLWTLGLTGADPLVVDVVVFAVGQLSHPVVPTLPGRETFAGPQFHTAAWDHSVELTGTRVAVVGTGASAVQVVPAIAPEVSRLTVFQRSAPYLLPRPDCEFGDRRQRVFRSVPASQLLERVTWYSLVETLSVAWVHAPALSSMIRSVSHEHMRRGSRGRPGLFEKVWPDYPIGCKRILFSSDYLPALARPNVDLVTARIERITPDGIVTDDGREHPADVLVWGTGFAAADFLATIPVTGLGGVALADRWADGARAYFGLTVPDFPNLLIMYGPNTNTGGGSIIYFLETQARYVRDFVDRLSEVGGAMAVRSEVAEDFDDRIQTLLSGSVWTQCSSWYRDASGRVTTNWPLLGIDYRRQARFSPHDYEVIA